MDRYSRSNVKYTTQKQLVIIITLYKPFCSLFEEKRRNTSTYNVSDLENNNYQKKVPRKLFVHLISSHPLNLGEVVGAPQITLQQYFSTLPCLPLPSGNLQTPFPSSP